MPTFSCLRIYMYDGLAFCLEINYTNHELINMHNLVRYLFRICFGVLHIPILPKTKSDRRTKVWRWLRHHNFRNVHEVFLFLIYT